MTSTTQRIYSQHLEGQVQPVTDRERYFFDLNGFVVLKNAIDADHLAAMNAIVDQAMTMEPPLQHGEWWGGVHAHTYTGNEGMNLQQIYEAGEPFERLIDHPAWIDKVMHFVGGLGDFDTKHGPLFIDENFVSVRGPGDAIGMHSGGHTHTKRTAYFCENGQFKCGQVNILMALTDIGPGDGGTMVVPGSHKQNFVHPDAGKAGIGGNTPSLDNVEGAIEVHMNAGDALMFVDAICHGSALRKNEGQRRICVYRYGASWGNFRGPYYPTDALLNRLTPERAAIVLPNRPIKREPNRIPGFENPPHAVNDGDGQGL